MEQDAVILRINTSKPTLDERMGKTTQSFPTPNKIICQTPCSENYRGWYDQCYLHTYTICPISKEHYKRHEKSPRTQ